MKEFVKHLRNALRMTQADFAEYVGVSLDTVKSWESGRRKATKYIYRMYLMIDSTKISYDTCVRLREEWEVVMRSRS